MYKQIKTYHQKYSKAEIPNLVRDLGFCVCLE